MIFHVFEFERKGKVIESPALGTGDIERLKKVFPDNPIWKCRTGGVGNIYIPTEAEAKALYDALVQYYCANDLNDAQYPTGNATGSFLVVSNLLSVFDDLIAFFEKELGFKKPEEAERVISAKQKVCSERKAAELQEFRTKVLDGFGALPDLKKPTDEILLAWLKGKLAQYEERVAQTYQHPKLAMTVDPRYRDATFKIEILSAVLALKDDKGLNLKDLVTKALEKYGDDFDPSEYFTACGIIAHYLGTPFPGTKITKEPLHAEAVA